MTVARWLLSVVKDIGAAVWLLVRGARGLVQDWLDEDGLARRRTAEAFIRFVWRPLPVLAMLSGLLGLIVGVSVAQLLRRYPAELVVEPALARIMARDAAPLLVGVFASGRISVELAARIGAMKLDREIEALEALGHDPARYVVAPSLAAVTAAAPIQVLAAYACLWTAAGWTLQLGGVSPWGHYDQLTLTASSAYALLLGMAKALSYSLIALAVGVTIGSGEGRGPAAIGRQSTAAFTFGLLAIFAAAALLTRLK
jgi:ABC-type transporter Mla maintaining outer membrane lipid asymmetry permease subunit MlaE